MPQEGISDEDSKQGTVAGHESYPFFLCTVGVKTLRVDRLAVHRKAELVAELCSSLCGCFLFFN